MTDWAGLRCQCSATSVTIQWSHVYGQPTAAFADIKQPAETVMLADTARNSLHYVLSCGYDNPPGTTYGPSSIHNGGANAAFVNGHVKWMKIPGDITKDASLCDCN
ncbi:MAG: hypothetical protein GW893_09965 [Armatimonadetes bacterium]|nr:hypothetical protein [Armatimonadota bacterium]PIU67616.1 MAG: hypothetical protein COS85_00030 [Armatimonadetes bacterium CG07_land_8_20_14_0_80_59_28]